MALFVMASLLDDNQQDSVVLTEYSLNTRSRASTPYGDLYRVAIGDTAHQFELVASQGAYDK